MKQKDNHWKDKYFDLRRQVRVCIREMQEELVYAPSYIYPKTINQIKELEKLVS